MGERGAPEGEDVGKSVGDKERAVRNEGDGEGAEEGEGEGEREGLGDGARLGEILEYTYE